MFSVRGKEKDWFSNYLSDRKQRLVLGGATSTWNRVKRGSRVPQGSILGSLLLVNDLDWLECGVMLRKKVERLQNYRMRLATSPRLYNS